MYLALAILCLSCRANEEDGMRINTRDIGPSVSRYAMAQYGGEVFYVDGTGGNDLFDGKSWGRAKATIQAAVDAASPWSTIFVKHGTYDETVTIAKRSIRLAGESRLSTSLSYTGASSDALLISADDVQIESLTVDMGTHAGAYAVRATGRRITLNNLIIGSNRTAASFSTGISVTGEEVRCTDIQMNDSHIMTGIEVDLVSNFQLSESTIQNIAGDGVLLTGGPGSERLSLFNNSIAACGYGVRIEADISHCLVFHNNFLANATQVRDTVGNANHWFENYYSDHGGTDADSDGVFDTPYSFGGGGVDPQPLSARSAWHRNSLQATLNTIAAVPTADSTANLLARDVGGNKEDAAQTTVGTTRSIIAYVKGVLNQLATTLTNIAALWTGTKGLNDIHDDLDAHNTALIAHEAALAVVDAQIDILESHIHGSCKVWPSGESGIDVQTADNDDWALGALVEIMPAGTLSGAFELQRVLVEAIDADGVYELVIYAGSGDTELSRVRVVRSAKKDPYSYLITLSPTQPASNRIRAAVMSDTGNNPGDTVRVSLQVHEHT